MNIRRFAFSAAVLLLAAVAAAAQTNPAIASAPAAGSVDAIAQPARAELAKLPWEWGVFFQGGKGIGYQRSDFILLSSGVQVGKVLTDPHLGGFLRGQFEYAGEIMPYWQAFTPAPHLQSESYTDSATGLLYTYYEPVGGGTYTGASITPIILRWNFLPHGRFAPWFQAAGGLIYTTHKFPPDVLVPHGTPGGTSVFNFSPQGGVGLQYFISPRRSLMFEASGVHISSASLGDKNPGVNASVQFQIGYTWWSKR